MRGLSGTKKLTSSSVRAGAAATSSPDGGAGEKGRGRKSPFGTWAPSTTQSPGSVLGPREQAQHVSLSAEDSHKVHLSPSPSRLGSRSRRGSLLAAVGGAERGAVAPGGPARRLYLLRVEMHS